MNEQAKQELVAVSVAVENRADQPLDSVPLLNYSSRNQNEREDTPVRDGFCVPIRQFFLAASLEV